MPKESTSKKASKKNFLYTLRREIRLTSRDLNRWAKAKASSRKIDGAPKSFKKTSRKKKKKAEKTTELIRSSLRFFADNWRVLGIILLVYAGSYFVLAYATPNINLPDLFNRANEAGSSIGLGRKLQALSGAIFSYRSNATDFARWAQFFLAIIFSLVFIHAIREIHKGNNLRARDALYSGTSNLIPFVMGMSMIALQLIPFTFIAVAYNIGMSRGLFIGLMEKYGATIFLILSGLLTFWFIPTAIVSLYAVTLPGVYPSRAMQAVRIMVSQRRLEVITHLILFILFIFLSYLVLLLLLVTYLPRFANLSLDLFFLVALPLIHIMMYKLYLKLLESSQKVEA